MIAGSVSLDEIRRWPPVVDLPTAGRAFGVSRSYSFELAKRGQFPCRTIKVGSRYRVPTSAILDLLEGADVRSRDTVPHRRSSEVAKPVASDTSSDEMPMQPADSAELGVSVPRREGG